MTVRRLRPPLLGAVALAFLPVACTGDRADDPSGAVIVDTLPGGAIRATATSEPVWEGGVGWSLHEDLRIGRAEGDGPDVFGEVRDIAVDAAGLVYVLESQAREVRVFGSAGDHLRTLGREGSGPGELRNPVGLALDPADGALWVVDPGNGRYTVFDTAGTLRSTHPRPFGFFALPWPGGFDPQGRLHDVGAEETVFLARLSPELAPAESFPIPEDDTPRLDVVRGDGVRVMSLIPPLTPRLHWRFDPRGHVWTATSDRFHFVEHTVEGDTTRVLRREHEPLPVTRAQSDSVRTAVERTVARAAGPDAGLAGELRVPAHHPAFISFFPDGEGGLWVEPSRRPADTPVFEVFDHTGAYLGRVEVDPGLDTTSVPPRFAGGALYGLVRDELGIPYVVRFRVEGR